MSSIDVVGTASSAVVHLRAIPRRRAADFVESSSEQLLRAKTFYRRPASVAVFTMSSNLNRSPSAIKDALLKWCQIKTSEYHNVNITNFSSSWADGMAFCALIHHFYPETFDFTKLDPKRRADNLHLAFRVADEKADIMPLLEVQDMLMMGDKPDWKCIFAYVQCFYKRFRNVD